MKLLKKTVHERLITKVNIIDTSGVVLKSKYNTDKSELGKKLLILADLLKKTDYNAKISEKENILPSINGLATTSALAAVENKIPHVNSFVKKKVITQKLLKLKKPLLVKIMINMFLLQNLTSLQQNVLVKD